MNSSNFHNTELNPFHESTQEKVNKMIQSNIKREGQFFILIGFLLIILLTLGGCGGSQNNEPQDEMAAKCAEFVGPVNTDSPCWIYKH